MATVTRGRVSRMGHTSLLPCWRVGRMLRVDLTRRVVVAREDEWMVGFRLFLVFWARLVDTDTMVL